MSGNLVKLCLPESKSVMGTEKGSITQLKLVKTLVGIKLWTGERVWALGWASGLGPLTSNAVSLAQVPTFAKIILRVRTPAQTQASRQKHYGLHNVFFFSSLRKTNETLIGGYKANEDDSIIITKSDQHIMVFSPKSEVSTNRWPVYMTTSAVGSQYNQ